MKIAQIMVDGFEDIEAITTIDLLRRANIQVDTISLENKDYLKSAHNVVLMADYHLAEVSLAEYDGYILPGGPGFELYSTNTVLKDTLIRAAKDNKMIAAICAAPSYLAEIGLLDNHKATIFPEMATELTSRKITYITNTVVTSNNIITGPAAGSAIEFSLAIITYLKDQQVSTTIKDNIYF